MAYQTPLLPFLRPLRLPRPQTIQHFLRFTTTSKCSAASAQQRPQQKEDRNLLASLTAPQTYPPTSMKSDPRPKISKASRRTAHPPKKRTYPTRQPTHTPQVPQTLTPAPVPLLPESESAPNLPYFITRTPSNELPVYTDFKRGGNLKLTLVRKVAGDVGKLRDDLRVGLQLGRDGGGRERVTVNEVTRQVVIKGQVKGEVERWLRERRF